MKIGCCSDALQDKVSPTKYVCVEHCSESKKDLQPELLLYVEECLSFLKKIHRRAAFSALFKHECSEAATLVHHAQPKVF